MPPKSVFLPNIRLSSINVSGESPTHADRTPEQVRMDIKKKHAVHPDDILSIFRRVFPVAAELIRHVLRGATSTSDHLPGLYAVYAGSHPRVHEMLTYGLRAVGMEEIHAHQLVHALDDATRPTALHSAKDYRRFVTLHDEPSDNIFAAIRRINAVSDMDGGSGRSIKLVVLPGTYPTDHRHVLKHVACLEVANVHLPRDITMGGIIHSVHHMHSMANVLHVCVYTPGQTDHVGEWVDMDDSSPTSVNTTATLAGERGGVGYIRHMLHQTLCHFAVNCAASGSSPTCWVK